VIELLTLSEALEVKLTQSEDERRDLKAKLDNITASAKPVSQRCFLVQYYNYSPFWSWSYTSGLASNTVVPDKTLCDMITLNCNKRL